MKEVTKKNHISGGCFGLDPQVLEGIWLSFTVKGTFVGKIMHVNCKMLDIIMKP